MSIKIKNNKKKTKSASSSLPMAVLKGFIAGVAAYLILIMISSAVILNVSIQNKYLFLFMLASAGVSAIVGSSLTAKSAPSKKLPLGMAASVILLILQMIILMCFNNASMSNLVYLNIPVNLILGFIGCIIGSNIRK